jgi:hypothetical protein
MCLFGYIYWHSLTILCFCCLVQECCCDPSGMYSFWSFFEWQCTQHYNVRFSFMPWLTDMIFFLNSIKINCEMMNNKIKKINSTGTVISLNLFSLLINNIPTSMWLSRLSYGPSIKELKCLSRLFWAAKLSVTSANNCQRYPHVLTHVIPLNNRPLWENDELERVWYGLGKIWFFENFNMLKLKIIF